MDFVQFRGREIEREIGWNFSSEVGTFAFFID